MNIDRADVEDALASATVSPDHGRAFRPVFPHQIDIAGTRRTIVRFLENIPDDLTVLELRDLLDRSPSDE